LTIFLALTTDKSNGADLCNTSDTLLHHLRTRCLPFIEEIPYKTVSNFKGFEDTETYFEGPKSSKRDKRIVGFKIDKEVFNHYTKNYHLLVRESTGIYKFDIVIDWNSNNSFISVTTPNLFVKPQYSKKIFFRIVKTDDYGNQAVLIVNHAKISMLISKSWAECRDVECVKRFKEWNNRKSKCKTNDHLLEIYYENCPRKFTRVQYT